MPVRTPSRLRAVFVALLLVSSAAEARAARCDPATQPAPHWGVKRGQCLKSCGAAGGTHASSDRCENHGEVSAGLAYDAAFCCRKTPTPAATAPVAQGRCFCSKFVGGGSIQGGSGIGKQYQVVAYPTMPKCRRMTYRSNGRAPWENGILTCDHLYDCAQIARQCKLKEAEIGRRTLGTDQVQIAQAVNELEALRKKCKSSDDFCFAKSKRETSDAPCPYADKTCDQICSPFANAGTFPCGSPQCRNSGDPANCTGSCVRWNRSCPRDSRCDPSVRQSTGERPSQTSTPCP